MNRSLKILQILTILFITVTYILDSKLYYYGQAKLIYFNMLPFGLIPMNEFVVDGYKFKLEEKDGMAALDKGVRYIGSNVVIEKVLKYGMNDTSLVGEVIGKDNQVHYFRFSETIDPRLEFQVNEIEHVDSFYFKSLNWIDIQNMNNLDDDIKRRNVFLILSFFLFIITFYKTIVKLTTIK